MRTSIEIETTPFEEDCAQTGMNYEHHHYIDLQRMEARVMIDFMRRLYPKEMDIVTPKIKINPHDFGSYITIQLEYDDENELAENAAMFLCDNTPDRWDRVALDMLYKKYGYTIKRL